MAVGWVGAPEAWAATAQPAPQAAAAARRALAGVRPPIGAARALPAAPLTHLQIVAYNKMDVPDSSDYWEDVREQLAGEGVPPADIYAIRWGRLGVLASLVGGARALALLMPSRRGAVWGMHQPGCCASHPRHHPPAPAATSSTRDRSAVSGRGVTELVRGVRVALDALPEEPVPEEGDERDQHTAAPALPGRRDADARISEFTIDSDLSGPRVWFVQVRARARATASACGAGRRLQAVCGGTRWRCMGGRRRPTPPACPPFLTRPSSLQPLFSPPTHRRRARPSSALRR